MFGVVNGLSLARRYRSRAGRFPETLTRASLLLAARGSALFRCQPASPGYPLTGWQTRQSSVRKVFSHPPWNASVRRAGSVWFGEAGPGDPSLLTLHANALREVKDILHDARPRSKFFPGSSPPRLARGGGQERAGGRPATADQSGISRF